jgi:hypothetical protein
MIVTFTVINNGGVLGGGGFTTTSDSIGFRNNGEGGGFYAYWFGNDIYSPTSYTANQLSSIVSFYTTGGSRTLIQNFTTTTSNTPTIPRNQGVGNNAVGRTFSIEWMTGFIHEIIVYNTNLSTIQRTQVENYLIDKWKIAYHPFKNLPPLVSSTFVPSTLPRCQLWLDGRDPAGTGVIPAANSTVSTWIDKSGNVNHAVGSGNATYLAEGGVNCDGTAYFLNTTLKMTLANRSVFFVMEEAVHGRGIFGFIQSPSTLTYDYDVASAIPYYTEAGRGFSLFTNWYGGNRIGYETRFGNTTLLPKAIYNENMNTAVGSGYLNGSNATNHTATAANTTCSGYIVGGRWWSNAPPPSGSRFSGVYHEIIAYDRGLINSERQQVEGYLAWKWNLNKSLPTNHPFYKVSPGPALRSIMLNQDELYLWLDASDLSTLLQNPAFITPVTASGQNVGVWLDKSGKQRHYLAQLNTYPTYSTRSQVPEVEFDVNGKVMGSKFLGTYNPNVANSTVCRNLDFFIVTRPLTSTGDWRTLFRGYNSDHHIIIQQGSYALGAYYNQGGGFRQYGSLTLDGSRRVIIHLSISLNGFQSASVTELGEAYDGNVVMSPATEYFNADNTIYYLGGYQGGSQPWGYVCEILVFKRNLANQEKIQVFNYLNSKWFTRVTLKNAIDYLPLATNATNLGTTPQTVTTVGNVIYTTVGGKTCAYFDNSFGIYLRLPYTNPEKFSFCFWLYPLFNAGTTYTTAISITEATIASPALQVDLNSTNIYVYTALPNNWTVLTSGTSTASSWTHYAVTINQTTFVQQLFVNGTFVSTATGFGSALQNRDRWILGRSGDAGRAFWGYIRQFAVFNTILTPYEIRDIYNATAS